MIILRFTGYMLALAAFCVLIVDGAQSIAASEVVLTSFGTTWASFSPEGVANTQSAIESYTVPFLWDPVLTTLLDLPAFMVALVLGVALAALNTALDSSLSRIGWRNLRKREA